MVKYTESQNKIVATGHTVVSFALVLLFVATIAWCILKGLSFAAPAVNVHSRCANAHDVRVPFR